MKKNLEKIEDFLKEHHVLSLATSSGLELSSCNLFYTFSKNEPSFIVASSLDTQHIQNILINPTVAGSIVLETKIVGKIQGIQFKGKFIELNNTSLKGSYFKAFPYALALKPKLWQIKVSYFKMTDNTLGFGKKIIWQA
ncbi:MAG: hypothetical protein COB17_03860 [Sulfurimonas sp.]|nr:MAG: hypothetical protein COB17_03860 [Sulfurimonas sp.]